MKMKMSRIVLLVTALALVLSINVVFAAKGGNNPLDAVWAAIADLQQQITNIQLIPGPQGIQGIQGEPGQDGLPGEQGPVGSAGPSLKVVDANGTEVGLLISIEGDNLSVWSRELIIHLIINAGTGNYSIPGITGDTYYESSDCSGTPMIEASLFEVFSIASNNKYGWITVEVINVRDGAQAYSVWSAPNNQCQSSGEFLSPAAEIGPFTPPTFVGPLRVVEQ